MPIDQAVELLSQSDRYETFGPRHHKEEDVYISWKNGNHEIAEGFFMGHEIKSVMIWKTKIFNDTHFWADKAGRFRHLGRRRST